MEFDLRRYLIILQLGQTSPERLQQLAPRLQKVLSKYSSQPVEPAFRCITADTFGYLIRSSADARIICSGIKSPDPGSPGGVQRFLKDSDQLLIVEIGEDSVVGNGFGAVEAWLKQPKDR
jgi:hypothetical protein